MVKREVTEEKIENIQHEITVLEQKRDKLLDYNMGGYISDAEFLSRNKVFTQQIAEKKANLEGCDACARRLFYEEFRKCFGSEANYVIHLIENKDDLEQEATEIYKELARKTNHLNEIKKNGK